MKKSSIPLGEGVELTQKDRSTHVHIIGRSGVGKSWLLRQMIATDICLNAEQDGPGFCLVDPAGDLYDFALQVASTYPELRRRIYLVDATQRQFFPGLNYLDAAENYSLSGRASMIIAAIQKALGQDEEAKRVLMERMFNLVLPVFLREKDYLTFQEMPAFIGNDPTLRNAVLSKLKAEGRIEENLLVEWRDFNRIKQPEKQKEQMGAVLNRVHRFATGDEETKIFCQPSSLQFRQIMDGRGIILARLPEAAGYPSDLLDLMGCYIVDQVIAAAYSRQDQDEERRVPFLLYLDEFSRFVSNRDIVRALNELRKFRVSFVMSHQHLTQLREKDPQLHASVKANCSVRVCFSLSSDDAKEMAEEMFSGELAADQVLDVITSQVITPVESTRIVESRGHADSYSESESEMESESEVDGENYFEGEAESESEGGSEGWSEAEGKTDMDAVSRVDAEAEGEGTSESKAFSESHGISEMDAETDMEAISETEAETAMDGLVEMVGGGTFASAGSTSQDGSGISITYTGDGGNGFLITPDVLSTTQGESHGWTDGQQSGNSSAWSSGRTISTGSTHGTGYTSAHGVTHATGRSQAFGTTIGVGRNKSHSRSHAEGYTHAEGRTHTSGISHADNHSSSHGRSWGSGESHAHGTSRGTSRGITGGYSDSVSYAHVPFVEQHVSREVSSRTFRSVQDKLARIVHRIVSQPHRHAFIQIGRSTPIPFATTDVTQPETTRTAASRIKRWAFQNNHSGRTEQEIEQFRLGRQKRVQAVVAAYREQLCAGASDAEFEEVDGKHQAKLTKLPRRSRRQTSETETRHDPNE